MCNNIIAGDDEKQISSWGKILGCVMLSITLGLMTTLVKDASKEMSSRSRRKITNTFMYFSF